MTTISSPTNTATQSVDSVVLGTGTAGLLKKGVTGSSVTPSGGDTAAVAQEVGTNVDDAAFGVATGTIGVIGALADETSPDSVDEGDAGALRMTLDRMLHVVSRMRAATATLTNVSTSGTSATLLAAAALRIGATIYNDSSVVMYVKFGTTASATSFTIAMAAGSYYEVPYGYTGRIDGILASSTGTARVTELTA